MTGLHSPANPFSIAIAWSVITIPLLVIVTICTMLWIDWRERDLLRDSLLERLQSLSLIEGDPVAMEAAATRTSRDLDQAVGFIDGTDETSASSNFESVVNGILTSNRVQVTKFRRQASHNTGNAKGLVLDLEGFVPSASALSMLAALEAKPPTIIVHRVRFDKSRDSQLAVFMSIEAFWRSSR